MNNNIRFDLNTYMPTIAAAVRAEPEHVQNKLADLVKNEMLCSPHMGAAWKQALSHAIMQDLVSPAVYRAFSNMGMNIPSNIRAQYDWKTCDIEVRA